MLAYHNEGRPDRTGRPELELTLQAMAKHHWPVVLLGSRSKRPRGKRWELTQDPRIAAQHVRHGGNLGLLCGPRSGVAVLDPDRVAWVEMVEALGQPADPWVETGSGKLHYYVRWQPQLPAKLAWADEVIGEIQRGPGLQQVVVPPSSHPASGQRYQWLVDPRTHPLEPLPAAWREYLTRQSNLHRVIQTPGFVNAAAFESQLARALAQPGARFRRHSGQVKFQCPACAAEGHDRHRDNAAFFVNSGNFGCAVGGRLHWRPIGELLGAIVLRPT